MKTLVYFSVTVLHCYVAGLDYCKWMDSVIVIVLVFGFCIWLCNFQRRADPLNACFNRVFANSECHTQAIVQDLDNPDVMFVCRITDTVVSIFPSIDQIISTVIWRSWIRASWYNYEHNQRDAAI